MKKIPVIAVVGPTASGKTALGVKIAKHYGGEVLSADSMQIYRELSVATAKPTADEMQGIVHHMIDCASVTEDYSVAKYCENAAKILVDINNRGKLPIIVGGTGLYVDSLLNQTDFSVQQSDEKLRGQLCDEYDKFGGEAMLEKLAKVDETAANAVHFNNKKRLVRFFELYLLTGKTMEQRNELSHKNESPFLPLYILITCRDRQKLYDKINKRVDIMIENGLLDEVAAYYKIPKTATASQAIGCKELKSYLDGVCSLDECTDRLKQATRRYAKRQLTWFLRNEKVNLMFTDEMSECDIINNCVRLINDFLKESENS